MQAAPQLSSMRPLTLSGVYSLSRAGWEDFYDVRITNVVTPGPAVVGQRIYGETGRYLRFRLQFEFLKIDPAHHVLVFAVRLPFGISVREDMDCIPLNPTQCRVNYRCNFDLPDGWRGVLLRLILRRELDRGPVDSLFRLKRAAEGEILTHADEVIE